MAQPTPIITVPHKIHVEIPPSYIFNDLPNQAHLITTNSPTSTYTTGPPAAKVSLLEARNRARVISAHTGVLLDEHKSVVVGGVGTTAFKAFVDANWSSLKTGIFIERYGPKSFIQQFVRGVSSTMDCELLITNWTLKARWYEITSAGPETLQEHNQRTANAQAYRDAVLMLQTKWTETYDQEFRSSEAAVNRSSGTNKTKEERKRKLYSAMKDQPPQPNHNVAQMTTKAQVDAAMRLPFFGIEKNDRLQIWRDRITLDVLASVLQDPRNVVDIRHLVVRAQPVAPAPAPSPAPAPAPAPAPVPVPAQAMPPFQPPYQFSNQAQLFAAFYGFLQQQPGVATMSPVVQAPAVPAPRYHTMWLNRVAQTMDFLDRLVIRPQVSAELQRVAFPDVRFRAVACPDRKEVAYHLIRSLRQDLGFDQPATWGTWETVPIISGEKDTKGLLEYRPMVGNQRAGADEIMDNDAPA